MGHCLKFQYRQLQQQVQPQSLLQLQPSLQRRQRNHQPRRVQQTASSNLFTNPVNTRMTARCTRPVNPTHARDILAYVAMVTCQTTNTPSALNVSLCDLIGIHIFFSFKNWITIPFKGVQVCSMTYFFTIRYRLQFFHQTVCLDSG